VGLAHWIGGVTLLDRLAYRDYLRVSIHEVGLCLNTTFEGQNK
jgi:hypothetical protein